jgi:hypothetical protein
MPPKSIVWILLLLAAAALIAPRAEACAIPVFQYARDYWESDTYQAIVFHRGALDAEKLAVVEMLKKAAADRKVPLNLDVQTVDLAGDVAPEQALLHKDLSPATLPWLVVLCPANAQDPDKPQAESAVWSGALDRAAVEQLVDSPKRKEIVRRLLSGDAAVWLLLESGDKAKDAAAEKTLTEGSAKLQTTLTLTPPGEDVEAPPAEGAAPAADALKVTFSVLRVSSADAAERGFVAMLRKLIARGGGKRAEGPVVLPIYARGRALTVVSGDGINADAMSGVAEFLCGPCSCEIKDMKPGVDLLIAADWTGPATEPAALTGVMPAAGVSKAAPRSTEAAPSNAPAQPRASVIWLAALALVLGVVVVAIVSLAMLRRREAARQETSK